MTINIINNNNKKAMTAELFGINAKKHINENVIT